MAQIELIIWLVLFGVVGGPAWAYLIWEAVKEQGI